MSGEGMVAVVQSLRDAGLAVTLLDGSRNTYSLVPNHVQAQPQPQYQTIRLQQQNSAAETESTLRCDSGAQATDGRYASVYQTTHCNLSPTSPPIHVTEFPPQRAELCPGHGNFEVGGLGSGETGRCQIRPHPQGQYRGGLNWVDRGAVCSPRPSQHIDAFANSLRKYPLSPVSSEVVERLITYSHAKNLSRNQSKGTSPVRNPMESEVSHQTYTERNPRRAGHGDMRSRVRVDEYPTRDSRPRREELDRRAYHRNYDVRFVRDVSRPKDTGRNCNYNYHYGMTEGLDSPSFLPRKSPENASTNSVHTETQAAVKMVSKEVATVPKREPVKKNVAVPRASTTSLGHVEGAVSDLSNPSQLDQNPSKIVSFKSVQTTSSSIELVSTQKQKETRRSKSEDDLRRQHFQEGIIELIGNIVVNSKAKDEQFKEKILKDMWVKLQRVLENVEQRNNREKELINISKNIRKGPILIPVSYEKKLSRKKIRKWAEADVYRVALPPFRISNSDGLEDVVKDWVNCLPLKSHDSVGRHINKLQICDTLVRKLLKLFTCNSEFGCETLKLKILNIIDLALLEILGKHIRGIIESSVDVLVLKLRDVAPDIFKPVINNCQLKNKCVRFNKRMKNLENNIGEIVLNEIINFNEKGNYEFDGIDINEISTELTDIILDYIYEGGIINENIFIEEVISILKDYNIEIDKCMKLAKVLLKHFKQKHSSTPKFGNTNFIVYLNTSTKKQRHSTVFFNASANSDAYRDDLCLQINDWLNGLPTKFHKLNNKDTRETIIKDLATDIVDQKKYIEFNASKTTDEKELEYLKYQIYKWIDKVVGDDNIDIMEHASDLMDRVRHVTVPKFTLNTPNILNVEVQKTAKPSESNDANENFKDNNDKNNSNNSKRRPSILKTKNQNGNRTESLMSCCGGIKIQTHGTSEQLNDEYDEYVKDWVKKIPISSTSPEERELAEKLRIGIYNGVWKALTKLKFDPGTFHNSFYYQDMLDDELEELFNCLPKSAELDAKKYMLKAQLLEQTTNTHEKIKKLAEPASFKQALVDNVANSIPKIANNNQDDPIKKFEDLQILGIVEDFIVIANCEEDNQVIANTFKKKLIKKAEAFVDELKKLHGKELKDIDMNTYTQDIIDALSSVPAPSEDSLKEEAEEIMLGIEIEHWFNDLPIISNDNYDEQLQRRRLRDKLTKKIADVQKSNIGECAAENAIKSEISKFLNNIPLQPEEDENMNFMVEELLNRIRNKKRERESSPIVDEASICFRTTQNSFATHEDFNSEEDGRTTQKYVQTTFSATNLTSRRHRSVKKTKSDEDCLSEKILNEIIYSYSNERETDEWRQRLQKKPRHVEYKMTKRLKKCLQLVSSQLSEFEEDTRQLKSDLTQIIVKKLTKMCLKTERERSYSPPINIYRVEVHKYVAQEDIEALKTIIENWLNVLPMKKTNSLGNNIEKKEIAQSLLIQLKPIIANRYKNRKSYWYTLRKNILKYLEDLPVMTEKNNKKGCLNRYANMLVQEILVICNLPREKTKDTEEKDAPVSTSTQNKPEPTKYDKVQLFVREEMFKFLRKVNLNYSDEVKDAEQYLINFLNAVSSDVNEINNVEEDLSNVLQNVGKWPLNQANYFVNMLMRRFNVFLKTNFTDKEAIQNEQNVLYIPCEYNYFKYRNLSPSFVHFDDYSLQFIDADNVYHKNLTKIINDWLTSIDYETPVIYKNSFVNAAVSDLVDDIIRKRQDLRTNNYVQHVKFQILKWVIDNLGEDKKIIRRVSELVTNILNIVNRKFDNNVIIYQSTTRQTASNLNESLSQTTNLPYEDQLVEIIFDWMHDLPADMHSSQNATLENQLIKDLASNIAKKQTNSDRNNIIDSEVDSWVNKALNRKPKESVVNILKKNIKDFPYLNETVSRDYKAEKYIIRRYEDIIDDWLNTIPIEPRRELDFAELRMDAIHELAMNIYKVKNRNRNDLADVVKGKLESNISDWLTKIPIHPRADRKSFRDQYAGKLLKSIRECNLDESIPEMEKQNDFDWNLNLVKGAALDWLSGLPLHKNSDLVTKKKQEKTINTFAKEYTSVSLSGGDVNAVIKKYVQILCEGKDNDDMLIENTYKQLQTYLNSNLARNLSKKFEISSEINRNILGNVDRIAPPLSSDIIFSAIFNWSSTLPLKTDHCPSSLKSLIAEMAKEIMKLIVHPEHSILEDNNEQIKQKIFEYVSKLPLRPDIKLEQICDMIADLWSILKDIHLYRDDKVSTNITQDNSMFNNNTIGRSNNPPNNDTMPVFGSPRLGSSFRENIENEIDKKSSGPASLASKNINESVTQNKLPENNPQLMNYNVKFRSPGPGGIFKESGPQEKSRKLSAPAAISTQKAKIIRPIDPELVDLQGLERNQISPHFHRIFVEYCDEIPLNTSTPEDKELANLARAAIVNGIWKAFFTLASDAEVKDDYRYFRDIMENRLNAMLDIILPQSLETNRFKNNFIEKVLREVMRMLKYWQYITDATFIRSACAKRINSQVARQILNRNVDMDENLCIQEIINEHLLYINYKETDPIKASIYRKRLEKLIIELINYIKTVNRQQSQYINSNAMRIYIHKTLRNHPLLDSEFLKDEVDEILLAQEIKQWFNSLPIVSRARPGEDEYRRKKCEVLAHKIHEIEKRRLDPDDSNCDREVRHEISKFLESTTYLKPDESLNINEMVGELMNRLKNQRVDKVIEYDTFIKENPACSTLAKIDPEDVFVANEGNNQNPIQPDVPQQINKSIRENIDQVECRQEILGTSQVAGLSRQTEYVRTSSPTSKSIYEENQLVQIVPQINVSLGQRHDVIQQSNQNFGQICKQCPPQSNVNQSIGPQANLLPTLNKSLPQSISISQSFNKSLPQSQFIPQTLNQSLPQTNMFTNLAQQPNLPQTSNHSKAYSSVQQPNAIPQASQYLRPSEGPEPSDQRSQPGQPSQGSRGGTASTVRVIADQGTDAQVQEELDRDEIRYRCRCLERFWRCRRRRLHCFMPFPCGYFY